MTYNFSISIMAVPMRKPLVTSLVKELSNQGFPSPKVFYDYQRKGNWYNATQCWAYGENQSKKYHLVLQDDSFPSPNAFRELTRILDSAPENLILSLYSGAIWQNLLNKSSSSMIVTNHALGAVAILMETSLIKKFFLWNKLHISPLCLRNDDNRFSIWASLENIPVFIPNPPLFKHLPGISFVDKNRMKTGEGARLLTNESPDWKSGFSSPTYAPSNPHYYDEWFSKWKI